MKNLQNVEGRNRGRHIFFSKRRPGGLIYRLEPDNTQWILQFPRSAQLMRNVGWFSFCEKLQGYNTQATRAFIKNYKGVVQLKNLKAMVNEESIAEAIGVPAQGERWFKQQDFQGNYGEFLLPGFEKLDWKNGIHVSKIKPNWQIPLEMVKNYITCEGRSDRIPKCHLR